MLPADDLGNHQKICPFAVPDNIHNACENYRTVKEFESLDMPFRIPESEFWRQSNILTTYEVYREVIRPKRPAEVRNITRAVMANN